MIRRRTRSQEQPEQQQPPSIPPLPRPLKYAWGVGMTLLIAASLLLDRGSEWLPLVNRAIDLLQQMNAPTENRSDTNQSGAPRPPSAAGS